MPQNHHLSFKTVSKIVIMTQRGRFLERKEQRQSRKLQRQKAALETAQTANDADEVLRLTQEIKITEIYLKEYETYRQRREAKRLSGTPKVQNDVKVAAPARAQASTPQPSHSETKKYSSWSTAVMQARRNHPNNRTGMTLKVVIKSGANLLAADDNGFSDPYVKLHLRRKTGPNGARSTKNAQGQELKSFKTKTKKKTLSPVWNETFVYEQADFTIEDDLYFHVKDWDRFGSNDFLGSVSLAIWKLYFNPTKTWVLKLQNPTSAQAGSLTVDVSLTKISGEFGALAQIIKAQPELCNQWK